MKAFTGCLFLIPVVIKQIILLTPGFPTDESDTTCIPALQDFMLGWKKNFPEIDLKVFSFQYPHRNKKYRWMGIPVFAAGGKDYPGIFRTLSWLKIFIQLLQLKRKRETILISYFLTEATFTGYYFSKFSGIKHIAIAAGQDIKKGNPYLHRIDLRNMIVVTLNEKMADELFFSCGRYPDHIIPMGFNFEEGTLLESAHRHIDVLIVGSLIPLKRVDLALKIIAALHLKFANIKSEIIGKGKERERLEKVCDELKIRSSVSFTGELKREEVLRKMYQGKILLHCSESEGQSTVITEALLSGLTVVCFDVGRIIDHEKIHVCKDETEMIRTVENLFFENQFDFSPVKVLPISETVSAYKTIIDLL